jgi:hypothetical protein
MNIFTFNFPFNLGNEVLFSSSLGTIVNVFSSTNDGDCNHSILDKVDNSIFWFSAEMIRSLAF